MAGGYLSAAQGTIEALAKYPTCHVEVTTLVIPGLNDSEKEMDELACWLATISPDIPYHVSRFFPCHHMADRSPTPVKRVYSLAQVARRHLKYVYTGNC